MTWVDRLGTEWRIRKAAPYVPFGGHVLDIGCAGGTLFRRLGSVIESGVGIDPDAPSAVSDDRFRFVRGSFPAAVGEDEEFDAIVALAVLEHLHRDEQEAMARQCHRLLRPRGVLIVTVPSPLVDPIIEMLIKLRVVEGISFHEHYGFKADQTGPLFEAAGLRLARHRHFQLRLNNLFVFTKTGGTVRADVNAA